MFELILINGLICGGVYASLAVGFSLIFGVAKIMNMAHTAFYMIAAFLIYCGLSELGFSFFSSAILAIIITILLGIITFKLLLDRVREHDTAVIVISIAVAMFFQETLLAIFGDEARGIPPIVKGFIEIAHSRVTYQHLITLGVCIAILLSIWALLSKTRLGLAMRAISQNSTIANVMGIDVSRINMITTAISVGFAAISGIVAVPIFMLSPLMWVHPLIIVLAAVVLGGLGSVKGSVIGAFILGFAETIVIFLVPRGSYLGGTVSLCFMVAVLIVRPEGLFGIVFEEERL